MIEKRVGGIYCEICGENPATELKGGKYTNVDGSHIRKIFICCKKCKEEIEDSRLNGK